MTVSVGMKIVGWIFLIAIAVGFMIENQWLFLAALVLEVAWLGKVLTDARQFHRDNAA